MHQAWGEVRRLKHAIAATVAAAGGLWPPISGNGNVAGGAGAGSGYSSSGESYAATAVEQAALRLEALRGMLEERREQDKVSSAGLRSGGKCTSPGGGGAACGRSALSRTRGAARC